MLHPNTKSMNSDPVLNIPVWKRKTLILSNYDVVRYYSNSIVQRHCQTMQKFNHNL